MPERNDGFSSLIKPPGWEVPGHTKPYVVPLLGTDRSMGTMRTLVHMLQDGIVGMILSRVQDAATEAKIDEAIALLGDRIVEGKTGYLLRVNAFIDAEETTHLASNLVSFLGVGATPIDALAESMRQPSFGSAPAGLRRVLAYRWCTRESSNLKITCSDVALGEFLHKAAAKEAERRQVIRAGLGDEERALSRIERATYLQGVVQALSARIADAAVRDSLRDMALSYATAEKAFNQAFRDFRQAAEREEAHAREAAFLGKVSTLLGVARSGIAIGQALQASPASSAAWSKQQQEALLGRMSQYSAAFEEERTRLIQAQQQIQQQAARYSVDIEVIVYPPDMAGPLIVPPTNRFELP